MEDAKTADVPHDGDFNSSDYTHNIDPSIGTSGGEQQDLGHGSDSGPSSGQQPVASDGTHLEHDSRAMEAVMQLAQAASQQHQYEEQSQHQQHGHAENSQVHHDSLPVNHFDPADKKGSKRRTSQGNAASARPVKYARQDAASSATSADESFHLPDSWVEGVPAEVQKAYQQHLASGTFPSAAAGTSSSNDNAVDDSNRPSRQLSTSKRAAQNRAAQRAFRERRDKYVKVLEAKATRLEQAVRVANECKRRYVESLHTVDGLRQDNHTLRVALGALSAGGHAGQPPQPINIDEYLESLPQIPPVTTDEEESLFPSDSTGLDPTGQQHTYNQHGTNQSQNNKQEDSNPSLDSLSAVAAAAAAAVHGDAEAPQDVQATPSAADNSESAGSAQTLPPVPAPAPASAPTTST